MTRPLDGLRVLDMTRLIPGPFATMILGDLGAQVDKLEDPRGGDYLRNMPTQAADGMNAAFHALNRGKRSFVLDLKTQAGAEAFRRLLPRYDVLVESYRPGVMERLGLGYEALSDLHPRLVYGAISGYGRDGPLQHRAGHDLNYIARAGLLGMTGPPEAPPQVPGALIGDIGGGALYAVIGILAALRERDLHGRGAFVDIAMCEGAAGFGVLGRALELPRGAGVLDGGIAPYRTYATKDGRYVALAALEPKFWKAFCEAVGVAFDPRALAPGPHQRAWHDRLEALFAARSFADWCALAERTDCCLEPVLNPGDLQSDPQHAHRGTFPSRPITGGEVVCFRTPVAPAAEGVAPRRGEHTGAILAEAGLSDEEREALQP